MSFITRTKLMLGCMKAAYFADRRLAKARNGLVSCFVPCYRIVVNGREYKCDLFLQEVLKDCWEGKIG